MKKLSAVTTFLVVTTQACHVAKTGGYIHERPTIYIHTFVHDDLT